MTSPVDYTDRIVIKRVKSRYLENIPYEYSFNDIYCQKNFGSGFTETLLPGQLSDMNFYREPGDCSSKLKIIAKTPNGIVESNALIIPTPRANQNLAFEIRTKGPKQIYLVEIPFREEIIPLSRVADVDTEGIIYNGENGEQKKIMFPEAHKAWKECTVSNCSKPKYIASCSESYPCELRFFTENRENIYFFNGDDHFKRWKQLLKKIRGYGYDIFDDGRPDVEDSAKYSKENILGKK